MTPSLCSCVRRVAATEAVLAGRPERRFMRRVHGGGAWGLSRNGRGFGAERGIYSRCSECVTRFGEQSRLQALSSVRGRRREEERGADEGVGGPRRGRRRGGVVACAFRPWEGFVRG